VTCAASMVLNADNSCFALSFSQVHLSRLHMSAARTNFDGCFLHLGQSRQVHVIPGRILRRWLTEF
jgi:hypothetical protein